MYKKLVQIWCIFDIIVSLGAFCAFIWVAATEENVISILFGSGSAVLIIMIAADVILFLAVLKQEKLYFRIWQIFEPIFVAFLLFIIDCGMAIHVLVTYPWMINPITVSKVTETLWRRMSHLLFPPKKPVKFQLNGTCHKVLTYLAHIMLQF